MFRVLLLALMNKSYGSIVCIASWHTEIRTFATVKFNNMSCKKCIAELLKYILLNVELCVGSCFFINQFFGDLCVGICSFLNEIFQVL